MDRRRIGRGLGWLLVAVLVAGPAAAHAQAPRPGASAGIQPPPAQGAPLRPGPRMEAPPPASRGWDHDRGDRDRGRDWRSPGWRPYAWDGRPGWYDPYRPRYLPPHYAPPAPVWVPGQWVWNGWQWVWQPGYWRSY
jgi:hypothetical protein